MLALLQFDASSSELIDRLIGEGRLPVLAELRRRGRWEPLESETDLFEAAVYPTIHSGVEVADHGMYYPFVWSAGEQRLRYMSSLPAPELVWKRLDRAGARSLVIDPYQLWEDPIERGISFSGWQFKHRIIPSWGSPRREWLRAVRRFGRPPLLVDVAGRRAPGDLLRMFEVFLAGPDRVADLFTDLMARERFDFAWLSLISVHLGGHHLWDLSQLRGAALSEEERARLADGLAEVYARADAALGRMLEALPPGADVIVLSPLGMGVQTASSDLLPEMVDRVLAGGARRETAPPSDPIWRLRARVPPVARRAVNRAMPARVVREGVARAYVRGFDWRRTRAFTLPGDHFGYVRLNVRDREREGVVDPADADALVEELAAGLITFTDEAGPPRVAEVHRPRSELEGRRVEDLPDLVVRWSDHPSTRLTGVTSPAFGRVERRAGGTGRPGNHHRGAWILTLPGRASGRVLGRAPRLTDLAATAAARAGVKEFRGEPLLDDPRVTLSSHA